MAIRKSKLTLSILLSIPETVARIAAALGVDPFQRLPFSAAVHGIGWCDPESGIRP
ncbi:MAG: hypothetical protein WBZ31_04400 [Thiobacillus sp.]